MKSFHFNEPLYISSSVDLVIITTLSALIIFVNGKYLKDMNEDDKNRLPGTPRSLIQDVMVTRTKATFHLPFYYLLAWFLSQGYLLPEWFYQMLSYEQYLTLFLRFYFPFTSLIIASMRYVFIVHQKKILTFGKNLAKRLFYYSSIGLPMLMAVLHACTIPVPSSGYNRPHKVCVKFFETSYNMTCGDPDGVKDDCAPILSRVHHLIPSNITQIVGIVVKFFFIVMCTNVLDGILYYKTFKTIRE